MSEKIVNTISVYYREIPAVLMSLISTDGNASYCKDGVKKGTGHQCPRLTVHLYTTDNPVKDQKRIDNFERILDELEANNQIVSFSILKGESIIL